MEILRNGLTNASCEEINLWQFASVLVAKQVNALIIIEVHARDIIDTFVRDSILDYREFAWESQLRFYWDRKEDDTVIRCVREIERLSRASLLCIGESLDCNMKSADGKENQIIFK